jgi:hypothetical protein
MFIRMGKKIVKSSLALALLFPMVFGLCGCGKKSFSINSLSPKTFEVAAPETKEAWNTVLSAAKANDYAIALLTLQQLRTNSDLSAEQNQILAQTDTAVRTKMNDAARKGDAQAIKAIEDLRKAYIEARTARRQE